MKPATKIIAFIFGLVLPYIALVMYFALRNPDHPFPGWFPYFGLSYILMIMVASVIYSRHVYRNVREEERKKPKSFWVWLARAWMAYLVVVWSGLFLWGAYQTFEGIYEWRRTVPAGAFLLAFIGLFSWALYKDFSRNRTPKPSGDEESTSGSHGQ